MPRFSTRPGLERMHALLRSLDDPHIGMRGVLVAGTNGKGSVCALIDSICRAAGIRTALLSKPHLHGWRERIVVEGAPISAEEFAELHRRVGAAAARLDPSHGDVIQAEWLTLMGILAARDHDVDAVVCEVGMGGRLDATNVLDLGVCVITSIGLDHTDVLGSTVAAIATEKAGIFKPGNDVVVACADAAMSVLRQSAERCGAASYRVIDAHSAAEIRAGPDGVTLSTEVDGAALRLTTPLLGVHQGINLVTAVAACTALRGRGLEISAAAMVSGAAVVSWPGRLQWVTRAPGLLVDGAHNPQAMAALRAALPGILEDRPLTVVFATLADKPLEGMLDELRAIAPTPIFTTVPSPRSADPATLARTFGRQARVVPDLGAALAVARAEIGRDGVVLVCGSLALVGAVLALGH